MAAATAQRNRARDLASMPATRTSSRALAAFSKRASSSPASAIPLRSTPRASPPASFRRLAFHPLMGRTFTQQEDEGRQQVAVISYQMWHSRFHGDPRILGPDDPARPQTLRDHRRHAARLRVSAGSGTIESQRALGADELYARSDLVQGAGSWNYSMVGRLEAGRDAGAGPSRMQTRGAGDHRATFLRPWAACAFIQLCRRLSESDGCGRRVPWCARFFWPLPWCSLIGLRQSGGFAAGAGHPPPPRDCRCAWRWAPAAPPSCASPD